MQTGRLQYTFLVVTVMTVVWAIVNIAVFFPVKKVIFYGDFANMGAESLDNYVKPSPSLHLLMSSNYLRARVLKNSWVMQAQVVKRFPDELVMYLQVKKPVLRFADNQSMLDENGALIEATVPDSLMSLPEFKGSKQSYKQLFMLWGKIKTSTIKAVDNVKVIKQDSFGNWDIIFANNIMLHLGDSDLENRLLLFLKVAKKWKTFGSRKGQVFDMRYNSSFSHKFTSV